MMSNNGNWGAPAAPPIRPAFYEGNGAGRVTGQPVTPGRSLAPTPTFDSSNFNRAYSNQNGNPGTVYNTNLRPKMSPFPSYWQQLRSRHNRPMLNQPTTQRPAVMPQFANIGAVPNV